MQKLTLLLLVNLLAVNIIQAVSKQQQQLTTDQRYQDFLRQFEGYGVDEEMQPLQSMPADIATKLKENNINKKRSSENLDSSNVPAKKKSKHVIPVHTGFISPGRGDTLVYPNPDHRITVYFSPEDYEALPNNMTLSMYKSVNVMEDPLVAFIEFTKDQIKRRFAGQDLYSLPMRFHREHMTNGVYYLALTRQSRTGQQDIKVSDYFYVMRAGAQPHVPRDMRVVERVLDPRPSADNLCNQVTFTVALKPGTEKKIHRYFARLIALDKKKTHDFPRFSKSDVLSKAKAAPILEKFKLNPQFVVLQKTLSIPKQFKKYKANDFMLEFVGKKSLSSPVRIYRSSSFHCKNEKENGFWSGIFGWNK